MNKLDQKTRAQILHLLCEGQSIRAITRLTGASKNTVSKLLVGAGHASTDVFDSAATDPTKPIGAVQGAAGSYTTDVLTVGVHSFWVIVQDSSGHRSAASSMASVTVPVVVANPSAVADLAATLNA